MEFQFLRMGKTESALVRSLEHDSLLMDRVERLMSIPAVGPIAALTWALEVGDVQPFSSIKKAITYCGLCGAEAAMYLAERIRQVREAKHVSQGDIEVPLYQLFYDNEVGPPTKPLSPTGKKDWASQGKCQRMFNKICQSLSRMSEKDRRILLAVAGQFKSGNHTRKS